MSGYSMEPAVGSILELMGSRSFKQKRIAYIAASLGLPSECVLTTSQLFRSDLESGSALVKAIGLHLLSSIVNKDVALGLYELVNTLIRSPHDFIKKRAVLAMYRIYTCYPPALRETFPGLATSAQRRETLL